MGPLTGGAVSPSPMSALAGPASGPDDGSQQASQMLGQISDVKDQLTALAGSNPSVAPEVQQIIAILRQMVLKAAQGASAATASSSAVPPVGA